MIKTLKIDFFMIYNIGKIMPQGFKVRIAKFCT